MNDLISRQAACALICDLMCGRDEPCSDASDCNMLEGIHSLPSVQPERKKGKWIKEGSYKDRWGDTIEILRCPICEFKHDYSCGDTYKHDDGWFNFCPNCGADMRGEQDD